MLFQRSTIAKPIKPGYTFPVATAWSSNITIAPVSASFCCSSGACSIYRNTQTGFYVKPTTSRHWKCLGNWYFKYRENIFVGIIRINVYENSLMQTILTCVIQVFCCSLLYVIHNRSTSYASASYLCIAYSQIMANVVHSSFYGLARNTTLPYTCSLWLLCKTTKYRKFPKVNLRQANLSSHTGHGSISRFITWYITWLCFAK